MPRGRDKGLTVRGEYMQLGLRGVGERRIIRKVAVLAKRAIKAQLSKGLQPSGAPIPPPKDAGKSRGRGRARVGRPMRRQGHWQRSIKVRKTTGKRGGRVRVAVEATGKRPNGVDNYKVGAINAYTRGLQFIQPSAAARFMLQQRLHTLTIAGVNKGLRRTYKTIRRR